MNRSLVLFLCTILNPLARGDQGSFNNSGGTSSASAGVSITSNVASPPGSLTLNCPSNATGTCLSGNLTFTSTDGSSVINASFTSGRFAESCSGGGRGGHVTCGYSFTGYFSGVWTTNGQTQSINGVTSQGFGTGGAPPQGTTGFNSAYTPFYYSDSGQILRSDDLLGTNQITYGTQGSGVGQFYGAYGIATDAAGRIYVSDTYNCRIARIDDMKGTNWIAYGGTCGAGQSQFSNPSGIAVDGAGRIYVMDTGNARIVRMDDMTGANWVSYGSPGTGVGQLSQSLTSITVDTSGRIYVADTGNLRIVRFDDMTGTNWIALTQSPPVNGVSYSFQSPTAVALDSAGKIYIADNESYQPAVIRVDDMTGANWTSAYIGSSGVNSISVDSGGTIFVGGGGVRLVEGLSTVLNSSGTIGPVGTAYIFAVTPIPLPSPHPPAMDPLPAALTFANQNIGTSSAAQPVSITNFGGSPLTFSSIVASGGFVDTTNCPAALVPGSSCTVSVSFAPSVTGPANGSLILTDNSGNLGTKQVIALSGVATKPVAYVTPGNLTFPGQAVNVTSAAQSAVLLNTGTGPLQVSSVTATPPFSQTNNCKAAFAPGAGCTILVSFSPTSTGPATGTLSISGNAGNQTVVLSGTGSSTAPVVTISPASLLFPEQLVSKKSGAQIVTIANTGSTAVVNKGITISGDFAETSRCSSSLPAGGKCVVAVTFTPTAAGTRTGVLTVNLSTGTRTVALTGTGSTGTLPGALSFSPPTVSFTGYTIGDNPVQTVTVTNTSGATVGILGIFMHGDSSLAEANRCGSFLAAGATCSISVLFNPVAYGTFTSTLTVVEGSGARDTVPVTGVSSPSS